jgi:hypothetical protein
MSAPGKAGLEKVKQLAEARPEGALRIAQA